MTREQGLWAAIEVLMGNTQAFKDRSCARARLEQPHLTEEQLEWSWRQVADQLGLPPTKPARGPAKA